MRSGDVRLGSEYEGPTRTSPCFLLTSTENAIEEGSQGGNAGAHGGEGELVAGPDAKVDVLPGCVEKRKLKEGGEADDADDADAVCVSDMREHESRDTYSAPTANMLIS